MKKCVIWIISAIFLTTVMLSACSVNPDTTPTTPTEIIEDNIFTSPTESETEPQKPFENREGTLIHRFKVEENEEYGIYNIYRGGEMHINYIIRATGMLREDDIGLLLLLDGHPQPYKTSEDGELAYLHAFSPEDGTEHELIFTPVIGKAGDVLELDAIRILDPDYYPRAIYGGLKQTVGYGLRYTSLVFEADPPEAELPEIPERVTEQTVNYVDLTSRDTRGKTSEKLQTEAFFTMTTDHSTESRYIFSVNPESGLTVTSEIFGMTEVNWSYIIYVNHQPVSVLPANQVFFHTENGQKTVIETKLDFSDFDGEAILYVVLCSRNWRDPVLSEVDGTTKTTSTYYLTDVENLDAAHEKYGLK